jgi:hypothetical protein
MTEALETVEEIEMLSVEELNLRLKRLRLPLPSAEVAAPAELETGGLGPRRELIDAADEAAAPNSERVGDGGL